MTLTVAALQYCASDDAAATLHKIEPLIATAAKTAAYVSPKRPAPLRQPCAIPELAEWENDSGRKSWRHWRGSTMSGCWPGHYFYGDAKIVN